MEFSFGNKHLENLFTRGKSNKYKFLDKASTSKFFKAISIIESAVIVADLWAMHSLNFEHLDKNRYSMRLSKKIRLEMEIDWEDEAKTIGVFTITDISKHYE